MPAIIGTGMHLPEKCVTNQEMFDRFGREELEKVYERIGHGARYHSAPDEDAGTHAVRAARRALRDAGITAEDVDLLIVATDTPAYQSPATAAYVQSELGARRAAAFDVNCACAASVTAMDIAGKYLSTDPQYRTALVIGTYAMSKHLDSADKNTYPLFGDGAGAVVLRQEEGKGRFLASTLVADGTYWDFMGIYGEDKEHVRILKRFPATLNADAWPPLIERTLKKADIAVQDVDLIIFTQIRKSTIVDVMEGFGLPMERTHTIMERWGYTGSACIPMALHDAVDKGKLKRGDTLVLCATGGGFAMACIAMTY